jgi:hypothetical protein
MMRILRPSQHQHINPYQSSVKYARGTPSLCPDNLNTSDEIDIQQNQLSPCPRNCHLQYPGHNIHIWNIVESSYKPLIAEYVMVFRQDPLGQRWWLYDQLSEKYLQFHNENTFFLQETVCP